jgi:hypothetical protein
MTLHSINSKATSEVSLESQIHALKLTVESLRQEMEQRDLRYASVIEHLTYRLETELPIRERLAALEARLPSR